MNNLAFDEYLKPEGTEPNLFRAAHDNDVSEMSAAIINGASLSDIEPVALMTPLHAAVLAYASDFLEAASKEETFDPWVRDVNGRTPYDHAVAIVNKPAMDILYEPMFKFLHAPDDRYIDYSDNAPALD